MKIGTVELLKFKKLKMKLRLSTYQAIGLLEFLWMFTARNAPLGDIGKYSNEDISIFLEWDGDQDELIQALVDCRWLDESDEHRLVIHDWQENMPNWLQGNLKKHGKRAVDVESAKQVAKQPAKQAPEQAAKQPAEQPPEQPAYDPASSLLYSSDLYSSDLHSPELPSPERPQRASATSRAADLARTIELGGTWNTPEFRRWYAINPRPSIEKKTGFAYQRAVPRVLLQLSESNPDATEQDAHEFLFEKFKQWAESPVGRTPPAEGSTRDFRSEIWNWLDNEEWNNPPERLLVGGNLEYIARASPRKPKPDTSEIDEFFSAIKAKK